MSVISPPSTASAVEMALPSVTSGTRIGADTAGAAMAAALVRQAKANMDAQYASFNFLNTSA